MDEIRSLLFLERGILYTIGALLTKPGINVRDFLEKDRHRLVNPVIFIIVTSLIYSFVNYLFPFEDDYIHFEGLPDSYITRIFEWFSGNYGYGNLILGLFIALWTRLFFKKYGYNVFEIVILLCFVMGISMLILACFGLLEYLTGKGLMEVGAAVSTIYLVWAVGQFFGARAINYLKAFLAYIFGGFVCVCFLILLGIILDRLL